MVAKTSSQNSDERRRREREIKRLLERMVRIFGLAEVSTTVDDRAPIGCRITRDGISITLSPETIEALAKRNWFGITEELPLRAADFLVVTHEVAQAADFARTDFFIEPDADPQLPDRARRFFNTRLDEIAIDARLKEIPFAHRYFDAYLARLVYPAMENHALHVQMMNALKLYLLQSVPKLTASWEIFEVLGQPAKPSALVKEVASVLLDPKTTYEERHRIGDELLYPAFCALKNKDLNRFKLYQFSEMYDSVSFYSRSEAPKSSEFDTSDYDDLQERVEDLYQVIKGQDIDQMIKDRGEEAKSEAEAAKPNLALPGGGAPVESLILAEVDIPSYFTMVNNWHSTIEQVAEVFITLASPKESISVPRYRHRRTFEGARFDSGSLTDASIQLATGIPRPIWQPVEKKIKHQELQFNGLDFYLLLDVSYSMKGENAECASAMAVCLLEGLRLARHRVEMDTILGQVDVRVQILAFGSGWADLTPLSKEPSFEQKESAYYNLMNPESYHTMVNGALKHVRSLSQAYPERDAVCLIISDGLFADNLAAYKTVQSMPGNVYVGHINIGSFAGIPITLHYDAVPDARVLPQKLQGILAQYIEASLQRYGI